MRFTSGEQVMATLDAEDHTHLQITSPMIIKAVPVIADGRMHEQVVVQPFCQFSEDKHFDIPKTSIVFVKRLHEALIPHYLKLVETYEETVLVKPRTVAGWQDEEEMTAEDFERKLDELEERYFGVDSETDNKPSVESVEFDGNDTVH